MENGLNRLLRRKGAGGRSIMRGGFAFLLSLGFMFSAGPAFGVGGIQPMASSSSGLSYTINGTSGSYDREYEWRLEKTGRVKELATGSEKATLEYEVSAIPDGHTDVNRVARARATFKNNLAPKTIHPKAIARVGGVEVSCTSRIILGAGSFVGPNGMRQIMSECEIPDHLDSNKVRISAWVEWWRLGPDGIRGQYPAVEFDSLENEFHKTVEVVDNKTQQNQEHLLGTAEWNSSGTPEVFEYTVEKTGLKTSECIEINNEAKIRGVGLTADHQLVVCRGQDEDPVIERNIDATFDRTYQWALSASGSLDQLVLGEDTAVAELDYQVTASPDGMVEDNAVVSGEITVHNPNDQGAIKPSLESIIKDGSEKLTDCQVTHGGGLSLGEVEVGAGETEHYEYTCELGDSVPSSARNELTVSWKTENNGSGGPTKSFTVSSLVDFRLNKEIDKYVQVYDDKTVQGDPQYLGTADWHDGATTFEYSVTSDEVPQGECTDFTNNAWIDSTDAHASATVEVCPEAGLLIKQDVDATVDRVYGWELTKAGSVDGLSVDGDSASATFNYLVTATPDGYQDVNPQVRGHIEVMNPNKEGDPLQATVTNTLSVGGESTACEVTHDGSQAVDVPVAPEETVVFDYTCDVGESALEGATNTATVTWGEGHQATSRADVGFDLGNEVNRDVTVLDDKTVAGSEHELGVATWNDDAEPTVFDYTLTQDGLTVGECTEFTNTAWIDGLEIEDTATVEVCPKEGRPDPPSKGEQDPEGGAPGSTESSGPTKPGGPGSPESSGLPSLPDPEGQDGPGAADPEGSLPAMGVPAQGAALTAVALTLIGGAILAVTRVVRVRTRGIDL